MTATSDNSAWLIEGGDGYWTGRDLYDLDRDHDQACRFSRQEDAERIRLWLIANSGLAGKVFASALRTTEHVWMVRPAQPLLKEGE